MGLPPNPLSRRQFLRLSAFSAGTYAAGSLLLAACAPEAGPLPEPTQAATQIQPDPTPTTAAAHEAPSLAAKVASGELPPLNERLPENPLVLIPINASGQYGGRLRLANWWLGGGVFAAMYGHSPLRFVDDGLGIAPGMCDSWASNADATLWTLHIRRGLKWSDGHPVTTADILFWWQDLALNPEFWETVPEFGKAGGKTADFIALDDQTLEIRFAAPAPLTAARLACWVNGQIGPIWIAPRHYLQQFHPRYNPEITDFAILNQKLDLYTYPGRPTLNPWLLTGFVTDQYATWERNPYYYAVDAEGNQLPYMDGIDETASTSRDLFILQAAQGEMDFAVYTYLLSLSDVQVLLEGEKQGNYTIRFWDSGNGAGPGFYWNYDCRDDALRALYRTPQFKRAMSHALDRPAMKRIAFYDYGEITTGSMSPKALEFNYNAEARTRYQKLRHAWSDYDPSKARALLDEIGVVDADGDGWRELPDGSRLEVRVAYLAGLGGQGLTVLQMAEQNWKDIGLNITLVPYSLADDDGWFNKQDAIRLHLGISDGPNHLLYPGAWVPVNEDFWAPLCGNLIAVRGTDAEDAQPELNPWERTPRRYLPNEPYYAGTPIQRLHQLYDQAVVEVDEFKRIQLVWAMIDIHIEEGPFLIGTVANLPRIVLVSNHLGNVPTREQLKLGGFCDPWIVPYPALTNPETYFFQAQSL
jgi:peptide/nickel transport system substrate-binding protein